MEKMEKGKNKPTITLKGVDGNVFNLLWIAKKGLKKKGFSQEQLAQFMKEATSEDYNHALFVISEWCKIL